MTPVSPIDRADSSPPVLADPAEVRRYVAKQHRYGYDVAEITRRVRTKFQCAATQKLVRHHLAEIRKWDAEAANIDREMAVAEQLAQLRLLRQKAYRAFDKSSQPLTKQAVVNGEVVDLVVERGADARFLTVILGIVDREIEMRDLKPVERSEVRASVESFDWNSFLAMPLQRTEPDPVASAFAALEAMGPRTVVSETAENPSENVTEGGK